MNVCLQEFFQFSQAILDSRYKIIHATQIWKKKVPLYASKQTLQIHPTKYVFTEMKGTVK